MSSDVDLSEKEELMNLVDFCEGIKFSKDEDHIANVTFPDRDLEIKKAIGPLLSFQRMSTLAIAGIINQIVREMPEDQSYLQVGTLAGFMLFSGIAGNPTKKCIGIDNFSQWVCSNESMTNEQLKKMGNHKGVFFNSDYKHYLKNIHKDPIGFYIYDAVHTIEDQCLGLQLAEPFFVKGTKIMIDDWNGANEKPGTEKFLASSKGTYKKIFERHTPRNGYGTFWNGIVIFEKVD
jgi:hypothetical protein